jgi:hypothetical protein
MYLLVREDKLEILKTINSTHTDRKITPKLSNNNNWIVSSEAMKQFQTALGRNV